MMLYDMVWYCVILWYDVSCVIVHDVQGGGGTDFVLDLKLNNEFARLENRKTGAVVCAKRAASEVKLHTISKDNLCLYWYMQTGHCEDQRVSI